MSMLNRFEFEWEIREDTFDDNIIHEVFTDISYDLSHIKEPIKTVVDIGAHIGSFSIKAHKNFPEAIIHSFEPVLANYELLEKNTNKVPSIHIHDKAVCGDKVACRIASSHAQNTGSNILEYGESNISSLKNIHIKEIQEQVGNIDLLKIDCEGGENIIFQHLDFSKVNYLYCELHIYSNEIGMDETVELIKNNGFDILFLQKVNHQVYNIIAKNRGYGN